MLDFDNLLSRATKTLSRYAAMIETCPSQGLTLDKHNLKAARGRPGGCFITAGAGSYYYNVVVAWHKSR